MSNVPKVPTEEVVGRVIDALNVLGVQHMLTGSLASTLYSMPRSTVDADFVVAMEQSSTRQVAQRLGPQFRLDPQLAFETVTATSKTVFTFAPTAFRIELFELSGDAHDQERFRRRRPIELLGRQTFVATPEDVVVTKLRWAKNARRSKDIDDVIKVILAQRDILDWPYVERWCREHGTTDLLAQLRPG